MVPPVAPAAPPRLRSSPPQRDGGSRDKILEVAEALYARRGFAGVGMREVAEAAGLTPQAHCDQVSDQYRDLWQRYQGVLGLGQVQQSTAACLCLLRTEITTVPVQTDASAPPPAAPTREPVPSHPLASPPTLRPAGAAQPRRYC